MIITRICGGMGNQMFQYAMARRLAVRTGTPLRLDLVAYVNGADQRPQGLEQFRREVALFKFNVATEAASPDEIAAVRDRYVTRSTRDRVVRRLRRVIPGLWWPSTHTIEPHYRFDPSALALTAPRYLEGYWQSYRYFEDAADVIRADLQIRDEAIPQYARDYVARLRAPGGPVVSLHVRRGDLAHAHHVLQNANIVHGAPVGLDYIHAAIRQFDERHQFLVFSDSAPDIAWCKQNIQADRLHFSEGHSDLQDFALMSACDHHIIANSTFSWWAAWLNPRPDKRVLVPRQWSVPGTKTQMVTDDLIPPDWQFV